MLKLPGFSQNTFTKDTSGCIVGTYIIEVEGIRRDVKGEILPSMIEQVSGTVTTLSLKLIVFLTQPMVLQNDKERPIFLSYSTEYNFLFYRIENNFLF